MAAIRPRNTKPEIVIRRMLHKAGFRFRLHRRNLPGTPDLTLKKWNAVIEVQGCFWHAHDCHLFRRPADNPEFWSDKHRQNIARDRRNAEAIAELGMRRLIIWECALKGHTKLDGDALRNCVVDWITGPEETGEVSGGK